MNEQKTQSYLITEETLSELKILLLEIKDNQNQGALLEKIQDLQNEISKLREAKKYWIVWDTEKVPEKVVLDCQTKLPILQENKSKYIKTTTLWWENILIEWDNYHALQVLNYTHKSSIDIIYIDPPYNTGEKDFVYNDEFVAKDDLYKHSKWLNFIEKRLRLAINLLKPDWLLVVSIDDNEMAQLKILLDELFNDNVKIVVVKMSEASGLKMWAVRKAGIIPKYKEYLLFAKLNGVNGLNFDYIKKDKWDDEYNLFLDNFTKEDRDVISNYMSFDWPLDNKAIKIVDDILSHVQLTSVNKKISEFKVKSSEIEEWRYANAWRIARTAASSSVKSLVDTKKKVLDQQLFSVLSKRDGLLYIAKTDYNESSKQPRVQIIFAIDNLMTHPWDFWSDIKTTWLEAEGGVSFKNWKKPLSLIKKILKTKQKDALVLDFFAWSWTTWHAVLDLNLTDLWQRKFILCTNNENGICENITHKRLKWVYESAPVDALSWLRYYKTDFIEVENIQQVDDRHKIELTHKAWGIIALKEEAYDEILKTKQYQFFQNNEKIVWIYFLESSVWIEDFKSELQRLSENKNESVIYMFSYGEPEYISKDFNINWLRIEAIPEPILKIYQELNKKS